MISTCSPTFSSSCNQSESLNGEGAREHIVIIFKLYVEYFVSRIKEIPCEIKILMFNILMFNMIFNIMIFTIYVISLPEQSCSTFAIICI